MTRLSASGDRRKARTALSHEWPNEAAFIGAGGSIPVAGHFKDVLGIDTIGPGGAVALASPGEVLALRVHDPELGYAEELFGLFDGVLDESGRRRQDITAVAVLSGPGSFTGLRIGVMTAKTLAFGLGVPLLAAPTLEMVAAAAGPGLRTAAIDAGGGHVWAADFEVTAEMLRKRPEMADAGYQVGDKVPGRILHARYSRYMQRVAEHAPELVDALAEEGARFTHHTSIAPTGTISLSLANNVSNGIEPSFAHHYSRNVIREGRKTKEKVSVYSYELLAYRTLVNPDAMPYAQEDAARLPDYFITAEDISPKAHVDIQAAAQIWVDSSISKTANVPTDFPYEDFKDIYLYAHSKDLKGCTTFRFNPEAFQGVLVKDKDLENTTYRFVLDDGEVIEVAGNEEVEYDGELHTAANLFDALKEGYYGKF